MSRISHHSDTASIFYSSYMFRLQRLLISYIYIYVLHTKLMAYAAFCHSEHCLWIHLVHSMHLINFTTNRMTTDFTFKVTTESHSLPETKIFIFPLFTLRPLLAIAALHMLKHSTTSISGSGGFANISPTVIIDS